MSLFVAAALLLPFCSAAEAKKPGGKWPKSLPSGLTMDSYVAAYNRGDAKAVAAHWSESGEWISPSGQRFQGKPAIEKEMQSLFTENKGVRIEVDQPVHSHGVSRRGHRGRNGSGHSPFGAAKRVDVSRGRCEGADGQWKLNRVRETEVPETAGSKSAIAGVGMAGRRLG